MFTLVKTKKILISLFMLFIASNVVFALPYCPQGKNETQLNTEMQFFANSVATSLFNFNFVTYKKQIAAQSALLDQTAWKDYYDYLKNSGLLDKVSGMKLIVNSYFLSPAKLIQQQNNTWQFDVPLTVGLMSANENTKFAININLTIKKRTNNSGTCGFVVSNLDIKPKPRVSYFSKFKKLFIRPSMTYQVQKPNKVSNNQNSLSTPNMDDTNVIALTNLWLLKQPFFKKNELQSILITQKGILNNRYTWLLEAGKNIKVTVSRSANTPYGLVIQRTK